MAELTREEALDAQENILSRITTHIPDAESRRLWQVYLKVTNQRPNLTKPCSCGGAKVWGGILDKVKEAVELALQEPKIVETIEHLTEDSFVVPTPKDEAVGVSKRKKKK